MILKISSTESFPTKYQTQLKVSSENVWNSLEWIGIVKNVHNIEAIVTE